MNALLIIAFLFSPLATVVAGGLVLGFCAKQSDFNSGAGIASQLPFAAVAAEVLSGDSPAGLHSHNNQVGW